MPNSSYDSIEVCNMYTYMFNDWIMWLQIIIQLLSATVGLFGNIMLLRGLEKTATIMVAIFMSHISRDNQFELLTFQDNIRFILQAQALSYICTNLWGLIQTATIGYSFLCLDFSLLYCAADLLDIVCLN